MSRILCCLFSAVIISACSSRNDEHTEFPEWGLGPFSKVDSVNPVLQPDALLTFEDPVLQDLIRWEEKDVFNPAAVVRNDTLFLLYRAEDTVGKSAGTSRIGLAWSTDGMHFNKNQHPVLFPDSDPQLEWEWDGGCEDPRVVQDESGTYIMTYTAYDGSKARLFVASSPDLYHWTKHGSAFAALKDHKYANGWSKSGSIVSSYETGTPVAKKIGGKYWMYYGDQNIWMATSDDLINWTPMPDNSKKAKVAMETRGIAKQFSELKPVLAPREKKFDSDLIEPGPPAMLTDKGVVLLYNSRNVHSIGDTSLPEGCYAPGQALMDKSKPDSVIDRLPRYFMKPDKPYEINGQVNHVCFLEGLVRYKGKWFLFYGTADSRIAVAVK
jgi:predicted GH43/DUF377 family glycosyl hydrolase